MKKVVLSFVLCFSGLSTFGQDVLIVTFQDMRVEIRDLKPFSPDSLQEIFIDHAIITADLGESTKGTKIVIHTDRFANVEIDERIETSMVISDEGPHCDLTDWKHYTSPWVKLNAHQGDIFDGHDFPDSEQSKFPTVTLKEVEEAVEKFCGERWSKLLSKAKSIRDAPLSVDVSKYELRIRATDKITGKKIEKMITIIVPMGC